MESDRILRHLVATVAFRGRIAVDEVPDDFSGFEAGGGVRTPLEILKHTSDMLEFAACLYAGEERPVRNTGSWEEEKERFFDVLERLDRLFAQAHPISEEAFFTMLQGPLVDAVTHIGQILTLRRLAGAPVGDVHYPKADIRAGIIRGNHDDR